MRQKTMSAPAPCALLVLAGASPVGDAVRRAHFHSPLQLVARGALFANRSFTFQDRLGHLLRTVYRCHCASRAIMSLFSLPPARVSF